MTFQGEVLPIGALLERALATPAVQPSADVGVRHTAADNAARCAQLLASGETAETCWRFGILQTLDDYTSTRRRGGTALAAEVFTAEPATTGAEQVDAAFAALANHLAHRDGWPAPGWAADPARRTDGWYPSVPAIFREEAVSDGPPAFRARGIFITHRSLHRA